MEAEEVKAHTPEQGMKSEYHGPSGPGGYWFHLYECQHISQGEYPVGLAVPLGPNINLMVCRHCWQQIKGMVAQEMIHDHLWHLPQAQKQAVIQELMEAGEKRLLQEMKDIGYEEKEPAYAEVPGPIEDAMTPLADSYVKRQSYEAELRAVEQSTGPDVP